MDTTEYLYKTTREIFKERKESQYPIFQERLVVEKIFLDEEHLINKFHTIMDIKNNDIVIR